MVTRYRFIDGKYRLVKEKPPPKPKPQPQPKSKYIPLGREERERRARERRIARFAEKEEAWRTAARPPSPR